MVCLYMHFKVGRSGETWDQRNKEQGSFLGVFLDTFMAGPKKGGILFNKMERLMLLKQ